MTKANNAARKRPTHFEQIPLEVVKKVAKEDVPNDKKAGIENGSSEPTSTRSRARSVPAR